MQLLYAILYDIVPNYMQLNPTPIYLLDVTIHIRETSLLLIIFYHFLYRMLVYLIFAE